MMEKDQILVAADSLKTRIENRSLGYDSSFIDFVLDYSLDTDVINEASLLAMELKVREEKEADVAEQAAQMLDLVARVADEYSQQALDESRREQINAHHETTTQFFNRSKLVFCCQRLTREFRTGEKTFRLGPLDLELRKGEITGVVGENSAGKTTLFRMIVGELQQTTGEIQYPFAESGAAAKRDYFKIRNNIAYVPQDLQPWEGSLVHHLEYEAALHGLKGRDNERRVSYVIERLKLGDYLGTRWDKLSGGYRFRFALAKGLVWRPQMMVLDEPLANLDVNAQLVVLREIKSIAKSISHPMAIVLSSQHIHEVETISDKLIFLRQGSIAFNGSVVDLGKRREQNIFEVASSESRETLLDAFADQPDIEISHNGMFFIISTDRNYTGEKLLEVFLQRRFQFSYFRDISFSSKSLFHKSA